MSDYNDPLVLPLIDASPKSIPPQPPTAEATPVAQVAAKETPKSEEKPAAPAAPAVSSQFVVVAPVTTGRSFILKSYYNQHFRVGQMLVKVSRTMTDAVIEVLEVFFPRIKPEKPAEHNHSRFFLGNLKVDCEDYWVLILEIRAELSPGNFPRLQYRMLHPSGRVYRPWDRLDLSVLKLRTTEAHRTGISAMTGVVYMAPPEDAAKEVFEAAQPPKRQAEGPRPHFQPGSRQMNSLFDRAGVTPTQIKKQLKPHHHPHDQIRRHIQRGLPIPTSPAPIPAARPRVDQEAIAEVAAKAGSAESAPAVPAVSPAGSPVSSGAATSVVEIEATIVTTAPQPAAPSGEGERVEANAADAKPELANADSGGRVDTNGVGA